MGKLPFLSRFNLGRIGVACFAVAMVPVWGGEPARPRETKLWIDVVDENLEDVGHSINDAAKEVEDWAKETGKKIDDGFNDFIDSFKSDDDTTETADTVPTVTLSLDNDTLYTGDTLTASVEAKAGTGTYDVYILIVMVDGTVLYYNSVQQWGTTETQYIFGYDGKSVVPATTLFTLTIPTTADTGKYTARLVLTEHGTSVASNANWQTYSDAKFAVATKTDGTDSGS